MLWEARDLGKICNTIYQEREKIINLETIKNILSDINLSLIEIIKDNGILSYVKYKDEYGYIYSGIVSDIICRDHRKIVNKDYALYNIQLFLDNENVPFQIISEQYEKVDENLQFKCKRCGEIVNAKWINICKKDNKNRHHILCPNCDGRTESLHALVLKQMFLHEYPDSEVEERSCINPNTNKVMPTDIVNHRLKIAVEVQSQFHDWMPERDKIKRDYWINKGYNFYDPDIRDYTILQMCQLFFDVDKIPDYINYNYSNKLNLKEIQKLLDQNVPVHKIAEIQNVDPHRIYDNIRYGNLHYSSTYINDNFTPIIQCDKDGNVIGEFDSLADAARQTGVSNKAIGRALHMNRHYSGGSFWFMREDFNEETVQAEIKSRFLKYQIPVDKYTKDNQFICRYDTIEKAAKDLNTNSAQIYRVVIGERQSIGGYRFKAAS